MATKEEQAVLDSAVMFWRARMAVNDALLNGREVSGLNLIECRYQAEIYANVGNYMESMRPPNYTASQKGPTDAESCSPAN